MKLSPTWKLVLTAVAVALAAFLGSISAAATWDGAAIRGAVALAVSALLQYLTPLSEIGPQSLKRR